jgi:hypothetical protein
MERRRELLAAVPPHARAEMEATLLHLDRCNRYFPTDRKRLLCFYGLLDWVHVDRVLTEDIEAVATLSLTFRKHVLPKLQSMFPRKPVHTLERFMDPYAAPGSSLHLAVERARRRATVGRNGAERTARRTARDLRTVRRRGVRRQENHGIHPW